MYPTHHNLQGIVSIPVPYLVSSDALDVLGTIKPNKKHDPNTATIFCVG